MEHRILPKSEAGTTPTAHLHEKEYHREVVGEERNRYAVDRSRRVFQPHAYHQNRRGRGGRRAGCAAWRFRRDRRSHVAGASSGRRLVRRRRRAGVRLPGVRRARARAAARRVRTPDRPRYARRDRGAVRQPRLRRRAAGSRRPAGRARVRRGGGGRVHRRALADGPRGNRPPRRRGRSRSAALRPRAGRAPGARKPSAPTRHQGKPPLQRAQARRRRAPHHHRRVHELRHLRGALPARHHRRRRSRAHRRGLPPLLRLREKLPRRREILLERIHRRGDSLERKEPELFW